MSFPLGFIKLYFSIVAHRVQKSVSTERDSRIVAVTVAVWWQYVVSSFLDGQMLQGQIASYESAKLDKTITVKST